MERLPRKDPSLGPSNPYQKKESADEQQGTLTTPSATGLWNTGYSVGVARLDEEHRKIFELLSTLQQAMLGKKSQEVLTGLVQELVQYAKTHFASEEAYFQMYGYPDRDAHKREHHEFIQKVQQFQADFAKGRTALSIEVFKFLNDWVKKHVLGSDKKYRPFLNSKGLHWLSR